MFMEAWRDVCSSSTSKAKFGECSISLDCIVNDPFVATNLCLEPGSRVVALCRTPPPVGFAKLNVDGPLSSSLKMGGLGGLLRDEYGIILFNFSESCSAGPPLLLSCRL
ncbi:hypothetical protein V6N11_072797 [Hibiscus sabdariffa]|uniref:Uncharacterized protein n=1 Tax=Hibiscus sabdariffa TaxID=183260 RepID=A0ABR2A5U8_9ROSI